MRSCCSFIGTFIPALVTAVLLVVGAPADVVFDLTHIGDPGNAPDYKSVRPPHDPRYVGSELPYYIGTTRQRRPVMEP